MKKEFQVSSDLMNVQTTGAQVLAMLEPVVNDKPLLFDVRLCFEEALINAMKYGNRLDSSKTVHVGVECDGEAVRIWVEDQGTGFDPDRLHDCTEKENLLKTSGRGVHLMRKLMDKVEYNEKGNRVVMTKSLKKQTHRTG